LLVPGFFQVGGFFPDRSQGNRPVGFLQPEKGKRGGGKPLFTKRVEFWSGKSEPEEQKTKEEERGNDSEKKGSRQPLQRGTGQTTFKKNKKVRKEKNAREGGPVKIQGLKVVAQAKSGAKK